MISKQQAFEWVDKILGVPEEQMSWPRAFALAGGTFVVLMAVAAGLWLISTALCVVYLIAVLLTVVAANVVVPVLERRERRD